MTHPSKLLHTLTVAAALWLGSGASAQTLPILPPSGYDTARSGVPAGQIVDVTYHSSVTGGDRALKIYLPPGYSAARRYGVTYMLHGIGGDRGNWFAAWGGRANIIADNLIADGLLSPVILVSPDTNATIPSDAPDSLDGYERFTRDLIDCIVPYVETHYSVHASAKNRALCGLSMGGGQTLNIGLGHLDKFAYLGAFSPAPNAYPNQTLFPDGGTQANQKLKVLLLTTGTNGDFTKFVYDNIEPYCTAQRIRHNVLLVEGAGHDFNVWKPSLWNFLLMAEAAGMDIPESAPTITTQPHSLTATEGAAASLEIVATGEPAPAFQWFKGGNAISGATAAKLSLNPVKTTDAGSYHVVVSNRVGSVQSSTVTLEVRPAGNPDGGSGGGGGALSLFLFCALATAGAVRTIARSQR